jgi:hypothetical protein
MTNSIADMELSECFLITGTNTTENHPVIATFIKRAVTQRGAKLILVDPRNIDLAKFATVWLRQKPAYEILFAGNRDWSSDVCSSYCSSERKGQRPKSSRRSRAHP